MRLVVSSAGFFPHRFGGGQTYVYGVARAMLERGHDVTVLTSVPWTHGEDDFRFERYEWNLVPVLGIAVNPTKVGDVDKSSELDPVTYRALAEALNTLHPDLTHLNGLKPPLIRLSSAMGIPHVLTVHHTGVACPNALLLRPDFSVCDQSASFEMCLRCCALWRARDDGKPALFGKLLGGIPVGVGRLANAVSSSSDGPYLLRLLRYPWKIHHIMEADHVILRESRLIICPSEAMKDLLVRNGGPEDRIVLLSHGIDVLPKTPLAPFDGRSLRFGYVGRVDRLKGLHVLVEAVQMLRPSGRVELHVYGAASSPVGQDYLENLLSAHGGQENICLHGSLQYEKMAEAFANIDVLVVPSIAPEAFGLVVVEAFSAGRPVIVFDSGALGELVRNGVDGFVVERNDPQALAEAMQRFIDDPGLVVKMAANIGPVKTMSQYVDELEVVYDRAISGYSPGVQKGNCW